MLPDTDLVIACPYCQAQARVFQLLSGNTMGAITWTDGWMDAPMLPRAPRITRCAACGKIYWVGMADALGLASSGLGEGAPHVGTLEEADCFEALHDGLGATPDLEVELRVFTWWRGNDALREPMHPAGHSTSPEAVANMERMIEMTATGDEDLLLFRAEAQRHLGHFSDARETLNGVGCSDYWPAKSRQLELLDASNRNLAILFSPEHPPETGEAAESNA